MLPRKVSKGRQLIPRQYNYDKNGKVQDKSSPDRTNVKEEIGVVVFFIFFR